MIIEERPSVVQISKWSAASPVVAFLERVIIAGLAVILFLSANAHNMPAGYKSFLTERITLVNGLLAVLFFVAWKACFPERLLRVDGSRSVSQLVWACVRGVAVMTLFVAVAVAMDKSRTPLETVLPRFALAATTLVGLRLLATWFLHNAPWQFHTNVVILGTGPMARKVWREIRTGHHKSLRVVGFVDSECMESALPEMRAKYLGPADELENILLREIVDLIVIAMPARSCYEDIQTAISRAEEVGVDLLQVDDVFTWRRAQNSVRRETTSLYSWHDRHQALDRFIKRIVDVAVSGSALVLLLPFLVLIAAAIKLSDGGPALFIQERYGYRRRKFRLLKFRTMVVNAEKLITQLESQNEAVGPIFKMKNDPRITKVGRFLRKTSLDELPQLWNVLIGNMSLVGPRPMSLRDVSLFSSAYLMRRFRVKPGITGLWQVSGRSNTSFEHWIAMDFRYIDQWSLLLDLRILLRTIPVVIKGSGAM